MELHRPRKPLKAHTGGDHSVPASMYPLSGTVRHRRMAFQGRLVLTDTGAAYSSGMARKLRGARQEEDPVVNSRIYHRRL